MSSKTKQVLLWLMIISSALVFVWFLQSRQAKPSQDLTIDMAVTRINNKDFASASFKQSQVEFTDASGAKFVTVIGSDATREMLMNTCSRKRSDFFQRCFWPFETIMSRNLQSQMNRGVMAF